MALGTKLGAWMIRAPFHTGGKLPPGVRAKVRALRGLASVGQPPVAKRLACQRPGPMRGAAGTGCPDATAAEFPF